MKRTSARQKGKDFEARVGILLGMWWSGYPYPRAHGSGSSTTQRAIAHDGRELFYAGDLYIPPEFPWCVECKNQQGWSLDSIINQTCKIVFVDWWNQCVRDASRVDKDPLLVFKKNRLTPLFVTRRASVEKYLSFEYLLPVRVIMNYEDEVLFLGRLSDLVELPVVRDG